MKVVASAIKCNVFVSLRSPFRSYSAISIPCITFLGKYGLLEMNLAFISWHTQVHKHQYTNHMYTGSHLFHSHVSAVGTMPHINVSGTEQ